MEKIGTINGLRGFAIILVVYHHLFGDFTHPGWYVLYLNNLNIEFFPLTYLSNGWIGVNLFFILSGFVLYLPYATGAREIRSSGDILKFYTHRAKRLLPLYYISLLVMVFLSGIILIDDGTPERLFYMLTMTFSFTTLWIPKYNPVLWSLAVEFWFCVLFPFIVLLVVRNGIIRIFCAVIILSLFVRFLGVYIPFFDTQKTAYLNALKDSVPGRLDDFLLGMLIAHLYIKKSYSYFFRSGLGLCVGLVSIFIACHLWDYKFLGLLPKFYIPFLNNIIQIGFFLIIVTALALNKGFLKTFFTNYPVQVIGVMCYSIYIWHRVAQFIILQSGYTALNLALYFLFLLAFSALTYNYIEYGHRKARELFAKGI